ncbi:MAG: acyl-CoA reductase [Candidatus Aenigmatarchaeota archaeon]|nr:hypothetical protein [Candidatus Aenigmarchaeota archaeon]
MKEYRAYSIPGNKTIKEFSIEINGVKIYYPSSPEELVEEFIETVDERRSRFRSKYKAKEIPKIWEEAGKRCKKACMENLEVLSATTKFPEEALILYIENIFDNLKEDYLSEIVEAELGSMDYLDGFGKYLKSKTTKVKTKAFGPRYVVHIFPESLGPQPISTFQSSVLKSPSISKPSYNEPVFTTIWINSLKEVDEGIGDFLWCIPWKGGEDLEDRLFEDENAAIIVYGAHDTINKIRAKAKGKVLGYPLRAGVEIVSLKDSRDVKKNAPKIVRDMTYMDQTACFSPHIVYVISRDSSYPIKLCEEMAKIMNEQKIRRKRLSVDEKSVISMLYHTYLLEKTAGLDLDVWKGEEYLIIYDGTNSSFELSPLYRTIRVKRIENLEDLKNTLYDYREYLQTIGTNLEKEEVAELFADYNISRIVDVGNMPITKIYHHEGMPLFSPLIKWIDIEEEKRPIRKIERKFSISYKSKSI